MASGSSSVNINNKWHPSSSKYTYREISGTLQASYNNLELKASFSGSMHSTYTSAYYPGTNTSDTVYLYIDGTSRDSQQVSMLSGTRSVNVSSTINVGAGNHTVSLVIRCGDNSGQCSVNNNANLHPVAVGSLSINVPNPYSKFSLSINSVTTIGKVDRDSFTVNYKLSGGTDNIQKCELRIYKGSTRKQTINISTSKSDNNQSYTFKPSSPTYNHGDNYSVSIYATDGTTEIETNKLTFYTYQEPKLTSVSVQKASPQNANTSNKFTLNGTNNRKWTNYEQEFQTHYRIRRQDGTYTSWTNLGNINSWSRNESQMRSLIPKQYDGQTNTIEFRRYNVSGRWYSATKSVNMVLYYRPRVGITSRKCNISYKQ